MNRGSSDLTEGEPSDGKSKHAQRSQNDFRRMLRALSGRQSLSSSDEESLNHHFKSVSENEIALLLYENVALENWASVIEEFIPLWLEVQGSGRDWVTAYSVSAISAKPCNVLRRR